MLDWESQCRLGVLNFIFFIRVLRITFFFRLEKENSSELYHLRIRTFLSCTACGTSTQMPDTAIAPSHQHALLVCLISALSITRAEHKDHKWLQFWWSCGMKVGGSIVLCSCQLCTPCFLPVDAFKPLLFVLKK